MKTYSLLLAALSGLAAVALAAPAQEPANQLNEKTVAPKPADTMAEEIEIMRRLLDRALAGQQHPGPAIHQTMPSRGVPPVYRYEPPPYRLWDPLDGAGLDYHFPASPGNTTSAPYVPPSHRGADLRDTQGVYLKGRGVVFTATLALPTAPPVGEPGKPGPKPPTDWERTRQELHGEKAEPDKAPASRDTLADVVLKALADNGKYFTQLPENEQITVALTLPRGQACAQCHSPADKQPKGRSWKDPLDEATGGSPATDSAQNVIEKVSTLRKDAQKAALVGDLHQKQGKHEQAAASFEEALKLYVEASEALQHPGPGQKMQTDVLVAVNQEIVTTAAKLIQVYTALGRTDRTSAMLKLLNAYGRKTGEDEPKVQMAAPQAVELPGKLVIAATKKQLDLVGSGKTTFEEFRKSATVDYQPGKALDKKRARSDQTGPRILSK
jgi:hypothetical protein